MKNKTITEPTKKIPVKQVTSWSYSRYSDYCQCPLKFKLKHLDKIAEPANDAMKRGIDIHAIAEKYVKGDSFARIPRELSSFSELFKRLRKANKKKSLSLVVEDNWAFTKGWTQTTWNDWNNCWVRIKLDLAEPFVNEDGKHVLVIRDWKTGKFREDQNEAYKEQLELYALTGLLMFPHVDIVLPELVYLDIGVVYPAAEKRQADMVFIRDDIPRLKKLWEKKVKPMMNDKKFAPRPNQFCKWCFYRKDNAANNGGGRHCKF